MSEKTMSWGYGITQPRAVNLDSNDLRFARVLLKDRPELQTCIACGNCTATCTAGQITDFNFRKVQTLARRGEYKGLYEELSKCMLCGKCRLSCPRGINTREIILMIKRNLKEYK